MRTQQGKIQVAHLLDTCYFYTHTNPLLRRKKKGNKRGERQDNLRKALIITEKLTSLSPAKWQEDRRKYAGILAWKFHAQTSDAHKS